MTPSRKSALDAVVAAARKLVAGQGNRDTLQIELEEAVAHLDSLPSESEGWRPIESAPRDETIIDVWQQFSHNGHHTNGRRIADAYYDETEGWVCEDDEHPIEWSDNIGQRSEVTHWRPLPPPPGKSEPR